MFNNVSLEFSVLMPRLIKLDQMVISVKIQYNFQPRSKSWYRKIDVLVWNKVTNGDLGSKSLPRTLDSDYNPPPPSPPPLIKIAQIQHRLIVKINNQNSLLLRDMCYLQVWTKSLHNWTVMTLHDKVKL